MWDVKTVLRKQNCKSKVENMDKNRKLKFQIDGMYNTKKKKKSQGRGGEKPLQHVSSTCDNSHNSSNS